MFWQGANVAGLASKVVPETPQSDLFEVFFDSLGRRWGHLGGPVASQSPFKKLSKINRNVDDFRVPQGATPEYRRPAPRAAKNARFRQK